MYFGLTEKEDAELYEMLEDLRKERREDFLKKTNVS